MCKLNRMGLMAGGFLLLLFVGRFGVTGEAVPAQPVEACTSVDNLSDQNILATLEQKLINPSSKHLCFISSKKISSPIKIKANNYLKIDGLNLSVKDEKSIPFPLLSLTGTGTVEFENLQLTNAFTGIEISSGITVKFTNSSIACGADPNSTGIRILSAIQNASIQDATINGCKIGIDDMGYDTSILGGSLTGSSGAIGLRSTSSGVTIDEGLAIKGFKEGVHLKGTNHLVAGISIVCDEIADSTAVTAKGNQIVLGPDITAEACTTGVLMDGQQITATMNNLNKISENSRIVAVPGTNGNIPAMTVSVEKGKETVWAQYDRDSLIAKKIVGVAPGNGIVEVFHYQPENYVSGKTKCSVAKKSTSYYPNLPVDNRTFLFECINLNANKDNKIWFAFTNENGTSEASNNIDVAVIPDPASAPVLPAQIPTETTFATGDSGSSDVFGDPSLEPGDDDQKGNSMSAGEGGLSAGGGSGMRSFGCRLNPYHTSTSGFLLALIVWLGGLSLLVTKRLFKKNDLS